MSIKSPLLVKQQLELENLIDELKLRKIQIKRQIDLVMHEDTKLKYSAAEAKEIKQGCDRKLKDIVPVMS